MTETAAERHDERIRMLEAKVESFEARLNALAPATYAYHIRELHMHDPVVKQLAFHLEGINVHQLSGELNLGNNFLMNGKRKERDPSHERRPARPTARTVSASPIRLVLTDDGLVPKYSSGQGGIE